MDIVAQQASMFDYMALDSETRIVVQQRTTEIKALMKRAASDIIEAGMKSIEVRTLLRHNKGGGFDGWIRHEKLESRMIYHFIRVAETFGNFENFSKLGIGVSALYLLSAPSTPESARQEAIERAATGEEIGYSDAKTIVAEHNARQCPYCGHHYSAAPRNGVTTCPRCAELHAYSGPRDVEKYGPYSDAPLPFDADEEHESHTPAGDGDRLEVISSLEPRPVVNHQLINQSTNNEWYTPRPFLDAAHEVMGGIDLDPASNPLANESVRAVRYYTIDHDGYTQPWGTEDDPVRVWLNPPYGMQDGESNQARWSRRLIEEHRTGNVSEAILLVNAVPGNGWFAPLKDFPICFPDGRIRFYNAETEAGQPTHSNALVYLGPNVARFVKVFSRFGAVMARLVEYDGHVFIHGVEVEHADV